MASLMIRLGNSSVAYKKGKVQSVNAKRPICSRRENFQMKAKMVFSKGGTFCAGVASSLRPFGAGYNQPTGLKHPV